MLTPRLTTHLTRSCRSSVGLALLASAVLTLACLRPARADLSGQSLTTDILYCPGAADQPPQPGTLDSAATAKLGHTAYRTSTSGPVAVPFTISGFYPNGVCVTGSQVTLRLGDPTTTYLGAPVGSTWYSPGAGGSPFFGLHLSQSGPSPKTITSVTVDAATTVPGFTLSNVSWDAAGIYVNLNNVVAPQGTSVTLDVTTN